MKKPKILVFIDWYLPGTNSGGPVRSVANLVEHLEGDFEFLVVTRDTDYCEEKPYTEIKSDAWNKLDESTEVFYFSKEGLNYRNIKKLIDSTEYDLAYVNGIYSLYFSILPVQFLKEKKKPTLVAARGMLNPQAFSVKPLKKKIFLQVANLSGFYSEAVFHATNENEKEFIKNILKGDPTVKVAPNLPRKTAEENLSKKEKETTKFVSVARIAREKGTLLALEALRKIKPSKVISYDIFGPVYDNSYWKECETVINKLPKNFQVNYKGSIDSKEVPVLLKNYHFFIMPSEGENFGHGILEAFTAGCPVIISDNTPWKNLKKKKIGWDVALDSEELEEAIEEAVAMDQKTYVEWSHNSWNFAREVINDPEVLEANKELFRT